MRVHTLLRPILIVMFGIAFSGISAGAAQDAPRELPGISAIGHGEARAPADTATLQILISEANYGGPPAPPQPGVEPGERERELIAPIVTALVDAGVPEEQITVRVGPSVSELGTYFGPPMALIEATVDGPEREQLSDLVDTATAAAADQRLLVARASALYALEDCSALQREAREAAVDDAQQQVDIMAELVGVSQGDLIGVRDVPAEVQTGFGPYGPVGPVNTCDSGDVTTTAYGGFGLPIDPTMEPEVTAYAAVELTYVLTDSDRATPAP